MIYDTLMIGIAGGSASGKSTLAAALVNAFAADESRLPVVSFAMDTYVHQDKSRGPVFFSESAGAEMFNWNHPDSIELDRLLLDLKNCASLASPAAVIIVEGLMALQIAEIRDLLDIKLFVDLDADERALRRMVRNLKRGQTPEFIAAYYLECARIGHAEFVQPSRRYADLIVRGDSDFTRIADMLAAMARAQIECASLTDRRGTVKNG